MTLGLNLRASGAHDPKFTPKGVSIESFSDEDILWAADALNSLPRKNLGYCTPEELFEAFLDIVCAA